MSPHLFPMVILIGFFAFLATLLGGIFALHFRDKLHLILGFSAGAVIGVAFFDLLPEAIELASSQYDVKQILALVAAGFFIYLVLDRVVFFHHCHDEPCANKNHRGHLGAGSLSVHSFLDGLVVGLAFQVSSIVGIIVTCAVLAHDFSDGVNTVSLVLKNNGSRKLAFKWLLADAISPFLGVVSTLFFSLPQYALGLILALFGGFFLYIGASDLLPESHHSHPQCLTSLMTLLGAVVLFGVVKLAGLY